MSVYHYKHDTSTILLLQDAGWNAMIFKRSILYTDLFLQYTGWMVYQDIAQLNGLNFNRPFKFSAFQLLQLLCGL